MTLRELIWAADAKQEADWNHTSELLANQINIAARKHVISAHNIHPFRRVSESMQPPTLESLADLVDL